MKYFKQLWMAFINKEKLLIIIGIFILLNISLFVVYQQSIYSQAGYSDAYPNAGLEFFYYIHSIGQNPYHFICLMLLLPNLISTDFLTIHLSHTHYPIETRTSKISYYFDSFIKNIVLTFVVVLMIEILIVLIVHLFYLPIHFNSMEYPQYYHAITQLVFHNEIYNLIAFLLMTAMGYSLVSALIFSFQCMISNPFVYRCSGVLIGILLVLLPAFIQYYLPINDIAFLLQINNLVCLGIEGVRDNPLNLSYMAVYIIAFLIYGIGTWGGYVAMIKWRKQND